MKLEYLFAGKYRTIVAAIGMFILLDASVLGLNFYISHSLAKDAVSVNLAGHLGTTSQRLVKALYELRDRLVGDEDPEETVRELTTSFQNFDEILFAFSQGGPVTTGDGTIVAIAPVRSEVGRDALVNSKAIWDNYQNLLAPFIGMPKARLDDYLSKSLRDAFVYVRANNLTLLSLMQRLSDDLEQNATRKATRLRTVQMVGIVLAVLNFLLILFHFIARLRTSDEAMEVARRETQEILETVQEGLLLIDRHLHIGAQHSSNLANYFGIDRIGGLTLDGLLEGMVTSATLSTAREYISLFFDPRVKENLVRDLNPLDRVEIHLVDRHNRFVRRYLSFQFNRVMLKGEILHALVTVNDVTDIVDLEAKLADIRSSVDVQQQILATVTHLQPETLQQFIRSARNSLTKINSQLKIPSRSSREHRGKIDGLMNESHKVKGEAAAIGLSHIENESHHLEEILSGLKGKADLTGNDFMPFTRQLNKLIGHLDVLVSLREQVTTQKHLVAGAEPAHAIVDPVQIRRVAEHVASSQGKQVQVQLAGLSCGEIPDAYRTIIRESVIQLVRNAVSHGIETVERRKSAGKPAAGRVEVILVRDQFGSIELRVSDDGAGIDLDAVRRRAVRDGLIPQADARKWDERRLASLIFEPGFTTVDTPGLHAGRGAGLDVVRDHIQTLRGRVRIATKLGRYTRIVACLPPLVEQREVA